MQINCVIHWKVIYPVDSGIHFFNNWGIRETNCAIHWIEIYLVDSIIHLSNNWAQMYSVSYVLRKYVGIKACFKSFE